MWSENSWQCVSVTKFSSIYAMENIAWVCTYVCSISKSSRQNCIFNLYVACAHNYKITKASILLPPGITRDMDMFCFEHFTDKLDIFTSHFQFNFYLKWIISIISYILSLWNLFETKIVPNGALHPFKNLLHLISRKQV